MGRTVYSIVLDDAVVTAVDALAHRSGMSRSAMMNRILAEKVSYRTPEQRTRDVLACVERIVGDGFLTEMLPSATAFSAKSALRFKYRPTVKYCVDLTPEEPESFGRLRVSLRTQSAQLLSAMQGFFLFWEALEEKYLAPALGEIPARTGTDRYERLLVRTEEALSETDEGNAIAAYINLMDGLMKAYFEQLGNHGVAKALENYYADRISQPDWILI